MYTLLSLFIYNEYNFIIKSRFFVCNKNIYIKSNKNNWRESWFEKNKRLLLGCTEVITRMELPVTCPVNHVFFKTKKKKEPDEKY